MTNEISQFLDERIAAGDFPSAVYLVAERGEIVLQDALGFSVVEPERIDAKIDTIYDLASLTKPIATGLSIARMIDDERLQLDGRVATYLKEFDTEGKRLITVLDLLTHTSHLPAWRPFYLQVPKPEDVIGQIGKTPLNFEPEKVVYSDLNFITLGVLVEQLGGSSLNSEQYLHRDLDLSHTFFNPPEFLRHRIAACEKGNMYEKQMCIEQGYSKGEAAVGSETFRTDTIWGKVHDGNAYFMGGVAGHAGLFSTAEDVLRMALQFLPQYSTLLSLETCKLFRTNLTAGMNEDRSPGFQLATTADSSAGPRMSRESFGHNGFTGTSLWIDPVMDRIFILLTNRTHYHSLPFANINSVRRKFHDLAINYLDRN